MVGWLELGGRPHAALLGGGEARRKQKNKSWAAIASSKVMEFASTRIAGKTTKLLNAPTRRPLHVTQGSPQKVVPFSGPKFGTRKQSHRSYF